MSLQDGIEVSFVRAEHSSFRWGGDDESAIQACGHQVHLLLNAAHWVHTDNPEGLMRLLAPSFVGVHPLPTSDMAL